MAGQDISEDSAGFENSKYKDGVNRNARLIVRNLSFKATENDLKQHFSQYGTVEEVKLLKKPDGRLVGCGFVHYTQVPMANKAIAATNKKQFLGRPITVSWAVPKDKYDVTKNSTTGDRKRQHSENFKPKLEDDSQDEVKPTKQEKAVRINRKARLIVRNISFKATEETLKEHFQPYGEVLEVKLLKKPDGKLVGCGFVHFKNVPMAKEAISKTNLKPFLNRPISVDWAVAQDQYMKHTINQQLELEEKVKKEESDSDDDGPNLDSSADDLKAEVKSESGSDQEVKSEDDSDSDEENDSEASDEEENDDGDDSDEEDEDQAYDDEMDKQSETSTQPEWKRVKLNDAEDGCTVFLSNVPFSVDDEQLAQFAASTGPVKYALVCVDKMTEHSKGSAFIKFVNKEDADAFLALPPDQLRLEGQVMVAKPALKRENLQKDNKKEAKDNRNLYLVKEGVVVAGTKAAVGVSASDMSKRLALERSKTQMLKNLNRFVSRYRIVVSNLPQHYDDAKLRRLCFNAVGGKVTITEARVMRDLRSLVGRDGKHPSKGYGFVMFMRHEDALACLRKLNNNPEVFDANNRPIVSFSIEDRTALNARKKRLQKSIENNPMAKREETSENGDKRNRKRKSHVPPDESYVKKGRFDNENRNKNQGGRFDRKKINSNGNEVGQFVRRPRDEEIDEYTGLTAKQGSQHKIRSNHKLKTQAEVHRKTVKADKKGQRAMRFKMAARERIKLPKQKVNKSGNKRRRPKDKSVF